MELVASLLMNCIVGRKWKRNPPVATWSPQHVIRANSCEVETISSLAESRAEAETGAACSSHPDGTD